MRKLWQDEAWEEYLYWQTQDKKTLKRINMLLKDIERDHWVLGENMGGCSYDIGVYPISFAHFFAGARMRNLKVQSVRHPEFSCDFGMKMECMVLCRATGFIHQNTKAVRCWLERMATSKCRRSGRGQKHTCTRRGR